MLTLELTTYKLTATVEYRALKRLIYYLCCKHRVNIDFKLDGRDFILGVFAGYHPAPPMSLKDDSF